VWAARAAMHWVVGCCRGFYGSKGQARDADTSLDYIEGVAAERHLVTCFLMRLRALCDNVFSRLGGGVSVVT